VARAGLCHNDPVCEPDRPRGPPERERRDALPERPAMSGEAIAAVWLSARVAATATVLNALVGIPLAYVLARRRFWGRGAVDLLVTLPLVLPPTVTGYYLIVLLGRRGLLGAPLYDLTGFTVAFTWYAAVIAATVMALPLLVRTARAAIESVDRDLESAAFTLGRSEWQTALTVTLPLARNGILAGLVLAFARALGEFGATLMLAGNIPGRTTTVPLAIYTAVQTGETGEVLALVGLLTGLSCAVLVAAGRLGARAR
jgi:molybdate transport system permease protein